MTQNIIHCNYIILGAYVDDHLLTNIYNNILRRVYCSRRFLSFPLYTRLASQPQTHTHRPPDIREFDCAARRRRQRKRHAHIIIITIIYVHRRKHPFVYAAAEAAKYQTYTKHNSIYTKVYIYIYGNIAHTILYTPFVQYFYIHT